MTKRLAKIIAMGVLIIMSIGLFAGCGDNKMPYNAVLYDDAIDWIDADLKDANITSGLVANDEHLQKSYFWLIVSQADFIDKINEPQINVDFDKQIVVIYTFTTVYATRKYNLYNLSVNGDILTVEYKIEKNQGIVGNASRPKQRWFIVTLDKVDVQSVNFIENK
jgi:hypothetical protein